MSDQYTGLLGNNGFHVLDTGSWRTYRPVMDKEKCIECGICYSYCPVFAIEADDKRHFIISYSNCKGCGICAHECPHDAIEMIREEK
ncbi:4Fe-4S binding protein [Peptoniphilaceae bacterium SGI.137]|nr:4Fe-4S binding protein [Peptoniphilaceae bacterium]